MNLRVFGSSTSCWTFLAGITSRPLRMLYPRMVKSASFVVKSNALSVGLKQRFMIYARR